MDGRDDDGDSRGDDQFRDSRHDADVDGGDDDVGDCCHEDTGGGG